MGAAGEDEGRSIDAIDAIGRSFHGVINSAAVIVGGAATLQASWRQMNDRQRDMVIEMVLEQSRAIQQMLGELSRRPPTDLHAAIERHSGPSDNVAAAKRAAARL